MRFRFSAVLAGLCGALATAAACADDWIELRTPHFTVISEASEGRTRDWAVEFELFRRGMSVVMPVDAVGREPVTLVFFRSDRRMRPYKPLENGKPARMAGYFVRAPGQNFLALAIEGARDDVREIIHHEGVHWHLSGAARTLPLWLEEGLAEALGNFRLKGSSFVIGANRPETMRRVRIAGPMPFADLMEIAPGELDYNGKHGARTTLFYQQSWAAVHALLFGTEGIGVAAFAEFIRRPPGAGKPTQELEQGLGLTAERLDRRLADYLERGQFRALTIPFDRRAVESGFAVRPASAPEVDLALGNLLVSVDRASEAEALLRRAVAGLPNDPRPLEAMALMSYQTGRSDDAELHFRAALYHGSRSYLAYYFLGQRALRDAMRAAFGPPDPTRAAESFVASLRIKPGFLPAAEALSAVIGLLPEPMPEAEHLVRAALARNPANLKLQAGLALLEMKRRDPHVSRSARHGVGMPLAVASPSFLLDEAARRLENREWAVEKNPGSFIGGPLGR